MAELTFDQLHGRYTSDQQVKDANARDTVPAGTYRARATKLDPQVDDRPDSKTPGRQSVRITAVLSDPQTSEGRGNVFFSASWEPHYNNGKPDGQTRLWGQFFLAFDVKPSEVTIVDMMKTIIPGGAFDVYVTEPIDMGEHLSTGRYRNYKTAEEKAALIAEGGSPVNFVQRVMRAK